MKKGIMLFLSVLLAFFYFAPVTHAEGDLALNWIQGPTTVEMGDKLVNLQVTENYLFLNKEDTVAYNDAIGNIETGLEIGSIYPISEEENWFIVFEYNDSEGFVKEKEEELDANELLASFEEGQEYQNKELEELGFPPMQVIGWKIEPTFDEATNNLTWALELETEGESLINYNVRLLNRYGYVSAILVADTQDLERLIPEVNEILKGFSFQEGKRYEDFNPSTDKISEYGLAALITGGVGAVAAKKGLFAALILLAKKFGIYVIAGIGGLFTYFKKKIK